MIFCIIIFYLLLFLSLFSIQRNTMAEQRNNNNVNSSQQLDVNTNTSPNLQPNKFWNRFNTSIGSISACIGLIIASFTCGYYYGLDKRDEEYRIKVIELEYKYKGDLQEETKKMQDRGLAPLTDEEYKFFYDNYIKNKDGKK